MQSPKTTETQRLQRWWRERHRQFLFVFFGKTNWEDSPFRRPAGRWSGRGAGCRRTSSASRCRWRPPACRRRPDAAGSTAPPTWWRAGSSTPPPRRAADATRAARTRNTVNKPVTIKGQFKQKTNKQEKPGNSTRKRADQSGVGDGEEQGEHGAVEEVDVDAEDPGERRTGRRHQQINLRHPHQQIRSLANEIAPKKRAEPSWLQPAPSHNNLEIKIDTRGHFLLPTKTTS